MQSRPRKPLAQSIAERIQSDCDSFPDGLLPSIAELSSRYDVSRPTLTNAVHLLREKGVLLFHQGQRIKVAAVCANDASLPAEKRAKPSAQILYEKISDDISVGTYVAGHRLPKIAFFAKEYRVSDHTVRAVFGQLQTKGLIHRKGKSWIVGSRTVGQTSVSVLSPSVIVLIQPREFSWRGLLKSSRTRNFCTIFQHEAERYGIQLMPLLAEEPRGEFNALSVTREELGGVIGRLEGRYLGALVAGSAPEISDLKEWVFDLSLQRKPVVWFDRYGAGPLQISSRNYVRCHFDEEPAVHLAVDYLVDAGHRSIGYPQFSFDGIEPEPWRLRRGDLVYAAASRHGTKIRVHRDVCDADRFSLQSGIPLPPYAARLQEAIDFWARNNSPFTRTPGRKPELERTRPLFYRYLLAHDDVTALIIPHDLTARHYYYWLRAAGLDIPRELSIISFDNDPELSPLPITTLDFGFGPLGYSAFHAIIGDVTVKRGRHGDIPTRPSLVVRGSVAPPRARHVHER